MEIVKYYKDVAVFCPERANFSDGASKIP